MFLYGTILPHMVVRLNLSLFLRAALSVKAFLVLSTDCDDLEVLAVGSVVAACFKAEVITFKAASGELVSELHCWQAGAQDSLTLEILMVI